MWIPKKFKLVNWMSFVDQEYEFNSGQPVLLIGVNQTDDSAESNGSGKSSLQEAIFYNLVGSSIRKVRDQKLIYLGEETAFNEFEYYNTITKQTLKITRQIFIKKSSSLQISINGKDQCDKFSSVDTGNKFIIDLIGITREDLLNYFVVSKEKYTSFFNSSDTKKKDLIGRFSNADKINGVEVLVQKDVDALVEKKKNLENSLLQLRSKIQVYQEEAEKFNEEKILEERAEKIVEIEEEIEYFKKSIESKKLGIDCENSSILELQEKLKLQQALLKENEEFLNNIKEVSFNNEIISLNNEKKCFDTDLTNIKSQKREFEDQLDEFRKFLRETQNNIEGSVKCPKCAFEFIVGDDSIDIEEAKKMVPEIEQGIKDTNLNISNLQESIAKLNHNISLADSKIKDYQNKINDFIDKKQQYQKKILDIKKVISSIESTIVHHQNMINTANATIEQIEIKIKGKHSLIEDLTTRAIEDKKAEYEVKINDLHKDELCHEEAISNYETEIYNLSQWLMNFKKFYSHLANKSLSIIEGYSNLYLRKMKTNLQLKFEGYKTLADGKLKENITPQVMRNGLIEGEFFQFSGGERGKLDFSTILTNQTLINLNSPSGGLDLLWIDECLDSVDGKGISCLIDSIKDLNKTVVITTHISHNRNENCVVIEKVNGISKILN